MKYRIFTKILKQILGNTKINFQELLRYHFDICTGYLEMKCFSTAFYGTNLNIGIVSSLEHFSIEHTLQILLLTVPNL